MARVLATFFDTPQARPRPITAADEVDDIIIERGNYIPSLERAAETLSRRVRRHDESLFDALSDFLAQRHGVRVAKHSLHENGEAAFAATILRRRCWSSGTMRRRRQCSSRWHALWPSSKRAAPSTMSSTHPA